MIQNHTRLCRFNIKFWKSISRNLKTKADDESKIIKFTETINLPKTKFPARLNQTQRNEVENSIRAVIK